MAIFLRLGILMVIGYLIVNGFAVHDWRMWALVILIPIYGHLPRYHEIFHGGDK